MKVLMINVVCGIRSTGRICTDLATELEKQGHEVKIAYGRENVPEQFQKYAVRIGNDFDVKLHGLNARLFDGAGFGSKTVTKKFIEWIKDFNPDVIHLHNIHGYYINVEVLFDYLRTCKKRIIWTLHDCWSFTGHCVYFDYVGCDKWKTECTHCLQKKEYPACIGFDKSKSHYKLKKKKFTGIPSLVSQSFMNEYRVEVINNGVDTNVFKQTHSNLREKYKLGDKKVVLGVAAIWDRRKGLDTFIELSNLLPNEYQIILVGLSENQIQDLPQNIIGISKTDTPQQLAELYTLADVFVNPTLEDNYPTTNLEAIACGTPVITYNTGGSPESAEKYGAVVEKNVDELQQKIKSINDIKAKKIDVSNASAIKKYVELYND
jgi:glycosyltransferase involved in cell wall biosynthesis